MTATTEVVISEKSNPELRRSDFNGIAVSRISTMRIDDSDGSALSGVIAGLDPAILAKRALCIPCRDHRVTLLRSGPVMTLEHDAPARAQIFGTLAVSITRFHLAMS